MGKPGYQVGHVCTRQRAVVTEHSLVKYCVFSGGAIHNNSLSPPICESSDQFKITPLMPYAWILTISILCGTVSIKGLLEINVHVSNIFYLLPPHIEMIRNSKIYLKLGFIQLKR